jgi:O-antigen ligase
MALLLLWGGGRLDSRARIDTRGIAYDSPPPVEDSSSPWGVNVSLEQYDDESLTRVLARIAAAGLRRVRQEFPWSQMEPAPGHFRWERWDRIVNEVEAHGLELVAVLHTTPPWACEGRGPHTPPLREADFGRFARAFALRYGGQVHGYQIWDEPNLSSHWGDRYADPAAYARLLLGGASQIRAADPQALILVAGLAPTWEKGPLNLDEALFLRELYEAGAGSGFDVVAAKPYGFWSGPEDRRVSPDVLNFSRLIRLREVMEAHGDGDKPVWAVAWGWNALPPGWQGDPSPWGTDAEEKQIQRLRAAAERARLEWPWLDTMFWAEAQPAVPPDDPRWGFALLDPEGHPRSFYYALQEVATGAPVAYPGRYLADHPTARYSGDWRLAAGKADIPHPGDSLPAAVEGLYCSTDYLSCVTGSLTIPFYGTGLELVVQRGSYWAWLEVTVDGVPTRALPRDEEGRSYAILYDPQGREATIPLARGLDDGLHEARVVPHGGWGQWAIQGWVVSRGEPRWPRQVGSMLRAAGLLLLAWAAWQARRIILAGTSGKVPGIMPGITRSIRWVVRHSQQLALPFAVLSVGWFSLPQGREVASLSAAAFAWCAAWQPLWALAALLFALPFYEASQPLVGLPIASLDLLALATAAGVSGRWLAGVTRCGSRASPELSAPAIPVPRLSLRGHGGLLVALAGLSLASALAAEEKLLAGAALWRVMVLPGLCYVLVRTLPRGRRALWVLVDVWVVASVAAAGVALCQFALGRTVPAEGVQRLAGPYSSPNHLALFLERVVPLLLAVVTGGRRPELDRSLRPSRDHGRRWGYGLALLPILPALYLTYSRATWLLAVPVSLLLLGLLSGRRWQRWAWMAALLVTGAVVSWRGTERLASLFDLGRGTGAVRLQVWRATLEMIAAHPLLGIGLGNFQLAYPRSMRPAAWVEPLLYHSHNAFLDFAVLLGVGGLVLFVGLLLGLFRNCWRLLRALPPGEDRALVAGLIADAVGSLAHGLVDNGYFLPDLACLWALFLGLVDWLSASLQAAHAPNRARPALSKQPPAANGQ